MLPVSLTGLHHPLVEADASWEQSTYLSLTVSDCFNNSPHRIATPELALLTEQADYQFLSSLLLLSEEALYCMTLHRFSVLFEQIDLFPVIKATGYGNQDRLLQPKQTPYHTPIQKPRLERGLLQNFFLPNLTTQICPLCLQETIAYDHLYWKNRYLLTCQKHAVLLLRECSTCHKIIPSHHLQPTACPFCRHPYYSDSSLPISIASDALSLPRFRRASRDLR